MIQLFYIQTIDTQYLTIIEPLPYLSCPGVGGRASNFSKGEKKGVEQELVTIA